MVGFVAYCIPFCLLNAEICSPNLSLILQKDPTSNPTPSVSTFDDDDGIDTNVTFEQDADYSANESGRGLTRGSSSEMPSVYDTAVASPAWSFSSGGRSPDTAYLTGSEDMPSYKASPARPVGMPLPPKYAEAGADSSGPASATQGRLYDPSNDKDQFLARGAPAATSSSSAGPSSGGLRKRHSIAASASIMPVEVRSLTPSSSFPAPGARAEDQKPLPSVARHRADAVIESREAVGSSVAEVPVAMKEEPRYTSPPGASKETLGENWEMVSPVHPLKGLSSEWVSMPMPSTTDTPLEAPSVQGETCVPVLLVC